MIFGALGDIHADHASVQTIMKRHATVPFWICVGDVGDDEGRYEPPRAPLYWIKVNDENFDFVAAAAQAEPVLNLHLIPNGRAVTVGGLRVAGLGGTFAPTWYETPAAELPSGRVGRARARDDKRRHFVREEVDACKALRNVDLFLTHEAPRPFFIGGGGRSHDAGKTPVNEVLAAMKPRLHLFGHHHRFDDKMRQGVRSVCLEVVSQSYLLIDSVSMEFEKRET